MITVDVHAHAIVPAIEQAVAGLPGLVQAQTLERARSGPASLAVSGAMIVEALPRLTGLGRRLADMDAAGIDVQIVSPSPSQYHYWADADTAETVWRLAAEAITALCAQAPERLRGFGLAPLQHPELMVAALEHGMANGLVGVEISSHAPTTEGTVELSDARLEPFWVRAEQLGALIFLHPFGCTLDERLDAWYLSNIVGQPVENAVALSHLIMSGVLDRHPNLKILVAHGGGYLPAFTARMDHGWRQRSDVRGCSLPPSSYLRRLWFDSLVHSTDSLHILLAAVGADRVLLGSDYPFDMGVEDPVQRLLSAGLSKSDQDQILGGNAGILGLLPAPATATTARVLATPRSQA